MLSVNIMYVFILYLSFTKCLMCISLHNIFIYKKWKGKINQKEIMRYKTTIFSLNNNVQFMCVVCTQLISHLVVWIISSLLFYFKIFAYHNLNIIQQVNLFLSLSLDFGNGHNEKKKEKKKRIRNMSLFIWTYDHFHSCIMVFINYLFNKIIDKAINIHTFEPWTYAGRYLYNQYENLSLYGKGNMYNP